MQNKRKISMDLFQPVFPPCSRGSTITAGAVLARFHLETSTRRVYLCLLRGQPGPVRNLDEPDVVQVVLVLPAPLQAVVQEVGHAPKDADSRLQLQEANIKGWRGGTARRPCGPGLTSASGL